MKTKRIKGELSVTVSRSRSGGVLTAQSSTGESSNARDVEAMPLTVPIHDNITVMQSIGLGFRMAMLHIGDDEADGVATGTGLGSDAIQLQWRGRRAVVFGRDLFKAWVATFAPEDAERMP